MKREGNEPSTIESSVTYDAEEEWHDEEEDNERATGSGAAASSRRGKLATKPSDLELYEGRKSYWFPLESPLSEALPAAGSQEEQVAAASLFDFFRLVEFHCGKSPYLTWF